MLTSGGDAPGMNACIRAVVKRALSLDLKVLGVLDGYQGMIDGRGIVLDYDYVNNIIHRGGTVLGTARSQMFRTTGGRQRAIQFLKNSGVDGLIVIGGDGSFQGARVLSEESKLPVIGLPGTIDNDIFGTDHTIGFDTAINTVVEAVDKIRDTANSHHRIFFVEVMGRDAGFIALKSAVASGADACLIPEEKTDISEIANQIKNATRAKRSSIIIVAEGDDAGGAKEVAESVKRHLPNHETRVTILGHIQRGGSPTAFDRVLATTLGSAAVEYLIEGKSGLMLGEERGQIVSCSLEKSVKMHASPDLKLANLIDVLKTN